MEEKPDKPDSMQDMMERIRSGNVQLKKVQGNPAPKPSGGGSGDVMSEMAKLLVCKDGYGSAQINSRTPDIFRSIFNYVRHRISK